METTVNLFLMVVFGFLFFYGVFSRSIKSRISPLLLIMLLGILFSPPVLDLMPALDHMPVETVFEQMTRITLAIGLLGVAMRITPQDFRKIWRSGVLLIVLAMMFMWILSSVITKLVLGFDWIWAFLVGAIITPTDPIIASSIVTGSLARRHTDEKIRDLLSLESGANDGLAYLFVFVPLLLVQQASAAGFFREWILRVFLWEISGGFLIAVAIGSVAGLLFRLAKDRQLAEQTGLLIYTVAFSMMVLGVNKFLRIDDIWAVFVAGMAFNVFIKDDERIEEDDMQEASNILFTFPLFFLFGYFLPWAEWFAVFGWKLWLFAGLMLLLRRPPVLLAFYRLIPVLRHRQDALFLGWFGPIGVSAIFYATLALRETGHREVYLAATFIIFSSVVAHGLTAAPFTILYGKKAKQVGSSS